MFLLTQRAKSNQIQNRWIQVYWVLLLACPKEQGQRSLMLGLRQGGFLDLRQKVLTCQPGTVAVPKYGQKLLPGQALGWAGQVRRAGCIRCQKCRNGLLVSFSQKPLNSFSVLTGLEEAERRRLSSMCGGQQGFQTNNTNACSYFHHLLRKTPLYKEKVYIFVYLIGNWDPSILLE